VLCKSIREGRGDKTEFTSSTSNLDRTKLVHLRGRGEIFCQPPMVKLDYFMAGFNILAAILNPEVIGIQILD
jgi:hypothetical protein